MAQVSYGTITITDTNDIERIYMEYAQSSSNSTAPTTGWSEDIPAWEQGKYIWQRTVVKKEGVALSSDSYGDPVCLTGSTGSTGSPGATGRGVSSIVTTYCNYATGTPAANYSGWSSTVPTYDSAKPNYWIKTVITYTSGTPATDTKIYQDNGITSATATAASAKTQAAAAEDKADTAVSTANTANTNASNALNIANGVNQHFWWIASDTATTGGTIAAGAYITDIAQTTFKTNPSNYGNLLLRSDGVYLNLGLQTLASFKSNALTFYNSAGTELGKFGSTGLEMSGTLNIKGGGRIGQDSDNYWEFGDNRSYNDEDSAYLIGKGTASIQLGETGHWRLDKNRIHTGWYQLSDSSSSAPAGSLHFDTGVDGNSTYYWDYGMHYPNKAGNGNNKFLYIRRSNDTTNTTLATMKGRIDNDDYWTYKFYIDGNGNVHAPGFYIGDSTTPIGGGAGTVAERLTQGYGSSTQPIYFNSNGVPTNTTYALNAAGAKGVDTSISAASTSTNLPTSQAVAAFVEGKGYITSYTDNKVQTSQANTTKIFLAGTSTAGTSTGTLNFDSNVYLTTTAGTLHATIFEGNLSGTASRATADSDGNTIKSTYLKLSGGNVTGAVTFGSSVSVDELTAGDLVVNGSASFTNNLQANTINGVAVGSSPKFTDTVTTVTTSGNGNAVTEITASNGKLTVTKGSTFLTSYTETDPIFVASVAHGITSTDISNWNSKTSNTGTVTSVRVQASSPLTSTTNTASSTTLDTTIKFSNQNKNLVLAGPSSGSAAAPTFRSLVADDVPSISKSKISDFPTSLKNPNAIRLNLFNETAARAAANQGTATSYVDYDGNTANQSFSAAGKNALTSIGISGDTLSWVRADGSSGSSTVTITASVASGATVLTDTSGNAISTTGNTTPVWFEGGVPKDVTEIAFGLLPTGTGASNVAVGNHSHGNITNGGDITTTATIASGDRLVINDESASKINNSSITFGTSTTTFLSNKGTWETPSAAGSADAFSSAATIALTGDTTGSASSTKGWSVATTTNKVNVLLCNSSTNSGLWSSIKNGKTNPQTNKAQFYTVYDNDGPYTYGEVLEILSANANHWQPQLWFDGGKTGQLRHRNKGYNDDTWGDWYILLDNNNYTTYTVKKDGTGASGTWGISITGNAATATKATQDSDGNTITTSYLRRFPWWNSGDTHNIDDLRAGITFAYGGTHNGPTTGTVVAFDCSTSTAYTLQLMGAYSASNDLYFRNRNGDYGTWGDWRKVVYNSGTWGISITGNAATATSANTATTATYSSYPKIVAGNEIRFDVATKPSSASDLYFGYAWSDGSKDAKINNYVFDNGNSALAGIKAANFNGYTIASSVPSGAVFTDTKNTAGSTNTDSALFLIGATSQAANPQTYSHDTVKINTTGQIISTGYEMTTSSSMSNAKCQMRYEDSLQAIVFSFA